MEQYITPEVWTISQAAEKVKGLTPFRLREMCKNGEIPSVKAGRKYLISNIVLYRYLSGDGFFTKQKEQSGYSSITPIKP